MSRISAMKILLTLLKEMGYSEQEVADVCFHTRGMSGDEIMKEMDIL